MSVASVKGHEYATHLVTIIESGQLKKDYRPNHGMEFMGGSEELHKDRFRTYMGACTTLLMDERMKNWIKRGYYG